MHTNIISGKKQVAIIGAGISGLAAIKSCIDEDMEPVCFEQRDDIGGLWNIDKAATDEMTDVGTRIYSSCVLNEDKGTFHFSDFPQSKDAYPFPRAREAWQYLSSYADHFDLRRHIRFSTVITKVEKSPRYTETGRWSISSKAIGKSEKGDLVKTEEFDGVMICIGLLNRPYIPKLPGLDIFKGMQMHSGSYFEPYDFKDKTILVYGGGANGAQLSVDLTREAKKVYLSTRNGFWVVPRIRNGMPKNYTELRRFTYETRSLSTILKHTGAQLKSMIPYKDLSLKPKHGYFEGSTAIADGLDQKLISGEVVMMPDIEFFGERSVTFIDGKSIPIDGVLLTTGFVSDCSFLSDQDTAIYPDESHSKVELFLGVFPTRVSHGNFAFIGKIDPHGCYVPTSELQARVAARVIAGKLKLPPKEQMIAEAQHDNTRRRKQWGRNTTREILYCYHNRLADFLSAKPTLARIFCMFLYDPVLAWHVLMGPSLPPVYRLYGPHSKWNQARETILNVYDHCYSATRTITYQDGKVSFKMCMLLIKMFAMTMGIIVVCLGLRLAKYF